jgi:hypothetical protein
MGSTPYLQNLENILYAATGYEISLEGISGGDI